MNEQPASSIQVPLKVGARYGTNMYTNCLFFVGSWLMFFFLPTRSSLPVASTVEIFDGF